MARRSSKATPRTEPAEVSPGSLLIDWANQQDGWLRAIVSDAIAGRKALSDSRIQDCYDLFLREKELTSSGDHSEIPALTGTLAEIGGAETLVLNSLDQVENVNALASGQKIEFSPK